MPIVFNKFDRNVWIKERKHFKKKRVNVEYLDLFTNHIEKVITELPNIFGTINYKNDDNLSNTKFPYLNYNYGSPAPYLCKLLPNGYGFNFFEPNDIYKNVKVETGIQNTLYTLYKKGLFTRYKHSNIFKIKKLPENYILVSMQNTKDTVWFRKDFTKLANEIIDWSKESKRNVLFKWHFGCIDHFNPQKWWEELEQKSNYAYFDYTTPLNILIENCQMFWTASSMSGIEALICNKPVSIFGQTEYMEMTTIANTPEEAINSKVPNNLEQWLTYYVRNYCINVFDSNVETRIKSRIVNFLEKDIKIENGIY